MKIGLLLIPLFALICSQVYAQTEEVIPGYLWQSKMGAMRLALDTPDVIIFDSFKEFVFTTNQDTSIAWGRLKVDKGLTDLGKDVRQRLLDTVADVFVSHRAILLRKYPLDRWEDLMPQIRKVFGAE